MARYATAGLCTLAPWRWPCRPPEELPRKALRVGATAELVLAGDSTPRRWTNPPAAEDPAEDAGKTGVARDAQVADRARLTQSAPMSSAEVATNEVAGATEVGNTNEADGTNEVDAIGEGDGTNEVDVIGSGGEVRGDIEAHGRCRT